MKAKLEITLFGKENYGYGRWRVFYVTAKRELKYSSVTTDAQLIDRTFNCENPTQKSLCELRKACKK
jgi:hypothetical protein